MPRRVNKEKCAVTGIKIAFLSFYFLFQREIVCSIIKTNRALIPMFVLSLSRGADEDKQVVGSGEGGRYSTALLSLVGMHQGGRMFFCHS